MKQKKKIQKSEIWQSGNMKFNAFVLRLPLQTVFYQMISEEISDGKSNF
jgi:hypothetical protein